MPDCTMPMLATPGRLSALGLATDSGTSKEGS